MTPQISANRSYRGGHRRPVIGPDKLPRREGSVRGKAIRGAVVGGVVPRKTLEGVVKLLRGGRPSSRGTAKGRRTASQLFARALFTLLAAGRSLILLFGRRAALLPRPLLFARRTPIAPRLVPAGSRYSPGSNRVELGPL